VGQDFFNIDYNKKIEAFMHNLAGKNITRGLFLVLAAVSTLGLASCSSTPDDPIVAGDVYDPLENTNRMIFGFNDVVSDAVIHPVIKGYRYAVPKPARTGLRNFLRNLRAPVQLGNQLLQGDLKGAENVLVRTAVNTLLSGGLFDIAGYEGIEYEPEDFGQTLAVWGVGHGPYMVVPFLGPSSMRDYFGYAVDSLADPLRYYLHNIDEEEVYYVKLGLDYLELRDSFMDVLEDLESSSVDYYAAVRSTYYQRREALVNDENPETATGPRADEFQ
jgi:phospholipid-binding lipoprotein MlaA